MKAEADAAVADLDVTVTDAAPASTPPERPRITSRHRRMVSVAFAASAYMAARWRKRLHLPPYLTTGWMLAAPAVLARGFPRSATRDVTVWATHMWAYKTAFLLPHDDEQRHRERARLDTFLDIDRVIGLGQTPSERLQRRLRRKKGLRRKVELSWLDKAITFFYWTWYAEPHLVLALIRWRAPDQFPQAAARLAAAYDSTLIGYWAVPGVPPWYASEEEGREGGEVGRVEDEVARWLKGKRNPTGGDHRVGANPFAAMPSDHFGSAAMTARLAGELDPRLGRAAWAYAVLLGFCLVYLGEHYVIDLMVALALVGGLESAAQPIGSVGKRLLAD